jgi:hypothetical protein
VQIGQAGFAVEAGLHEKRQSKLKYYWQKTSQFKASCKDSQKLQESWIYKTANIFQGLAINGHEVLMFLQTRAKFLGTHSTTSVTVSVIRDFNMN